MFYHLKTVPIRDPVYNFVVLFRRVDYDGHYQITAAPTNDRIKSIEMGSPDVDWKAWNSDIKPRLLHRIPGLKELKVVSAWCTTTDVNTFDHNPLIGVHPYFRQL